MINLLSHDTKRELKAARLNVTLRNYLFFFIAVALLIAGAFGIGYWFLLNDQNRLQASAEDFGSEQSKYTAVISESKAFSSNLAIAKAILSNEILFSDFTIKIAKLLPSDAVLQSLNLATNQFDKPLVINVKTTSYDNSISVKNAFANSPLFDDVNIASTSKIDQPVDKYTHLVTLNVSIAKNAFKEAE